MRGHIRQILTEWSVKKITLENISDKFQDIDLFRNETFVLAAYNMFVYWWAFLLSDSITK